MSQRVRITEVGPRDGLQNEAGVIPTPAKVELIRLLAQARVDAIELTSFVSPRWVPQLADASDVARAALGLLPRSMTTIALAPNEKGWEGFQAASDAAPRPIDVVAVFTAASETFCQKNTNCTIAQSIQRFAPIIAGAKARGVRVRAYVSCVVACPFEGAIDPSRVAHVASDLFREGVDELDLGDTIGAGTPDSVARADDAVQRAIAGALPVTWHLHDTFGNASACVRALLRLGVRSFDSSVAGLGGCPYAGTKERPAPGNIATRTLLHAVRKAGYDAPVDDDALVAAEEYARRIVAEARAGGSA